MIQTLKEKNIFFDINKALLIYKNKDTFHIRKREESGMTAYSSLLSE
mgnify:CR=1 FL=1